jgi:MFS family permease
MSVTASAVRGEPSLAKVLGNANFRLLWIGQGTSLLGDQFYMIALPWLVLKLTNDPLALGGVLALTGIPRALFMLLGGAVTDRYAPRAVMLASDALRFALVCALIVLVATGDVHMWMLYSLAVLFGMISGFFMPASSAMMPMAVAPSELQKSNSLYMGTTQLANFIGPVLAGGLIALIGHGRGGTSAPEMMGIAAALGVDALSFLVSLGTLWPISAGRTGAGGLEGRENIGGAIWEGVLYVWKDALMRLVFVVMVVMNLLFVGPMLVGIPVLANSRLSGGAAAYGFVMGGYGGGNLLGILLSGRIIRLVRKRLDVFLVSVVSSFGFALIGLGLNASTVMAFIILLTVGIGNGTMLITLITSLQSRTPKELLGRIMSLAMLSSVGLVPVSQALTGGLLKLSLTGVFLCSGLLVLATSAWLASQQALKSMGAFIGADAP